MIKDIIAGLDNPYSNRHRQALILILLAGFAIRMYALIAGQGFRYFGIDDEVTAYSYALRFLAGDPKAFYIAQPMIGVGNMPGAAWTLFCVLILKLGGNVPNALYIISFLNVAAIYLVYRLALKFLEPAYALLSTFLFAIAPWAVYYSFGMWNPIPMAFWGALLFLSLWHVVTNDNSRLIFWVAVLTAIMAQFHMITLFYTPAVLIILFLSSSRINRTWLALGIAAGLALYLPYIIGEAGNHWENTQRILAGDKRESFGVLKVLSIPFTVLSAPPRWTSSRQELKIFADHYFGSYLVLALLILSTIVNSVAFYGTFVVNFLRSLRGRMFTLRGLFREQPKMMFIGIFLVVPPLFFTLTRHGYSSRYAIISFPLLFLLPAVFLESLHSARARKFFTINTCVMIATNIYLLLSFFHYQENQLRFGSYFLPSFAKMESVRKTLRKDAGPEKAVLLDSTDFLKRASTGMGDNWFVAGNTLSHYIYSHEKLGPETRDRETTTYELHLTSDPMISGKRIVYQRNGIAITRREDAGKDRIRLSTPRGS